MQLRTVHFVNRIAARSEGVSPIEQIDRRPGGRLPAGPRKRFGRIVGDVRHPGIDTANKRLGNGFRIGSVTRPFLFPVAAVLKAPRHRVPFDEVRPQHFGEPSLRRPPPQVHLKQAILGLYEPLRGKEVVLAGGGDVRNAPSIANDLNGRVQPGDRNGSRHLRQRQTRRRWRLPAGACGAQAGREREPPHCGMRIADCGLIVDCAFMVDRRLMAECGVMADCNSECSRQIRQ